MTSQQLPEEELSYMQKWTHLQLCRLNEIVDLILLVSIKKASVEAKKGF